MSATIDDCTSKMAQQHSAQGEISSSQFFALAGVFQLILICEGSTIFFFGRPGIGTEVAGTLMVALTAIVAFILASWGVTSLKKEMNTRFEAEKDDMRKRRKRKLSEEKEV